MERIPASALFSEKSNALVDKLVHHLRQYPCDLLDAHRLMTRFQASPVILQQAMERLENVARREKEQAVSLEAYDEPTRKLILFLLRHPQDLIDGHRLMRRFAVSSAQFQQALDWLTQQKLEDEGGWGETQRVFE